MQPSHRRRSRPGIADVERMILVVRGHRVVLDSTIAARCGVSVKRLKQAVKRNRNRFPADFLFELTLRETQFPRSQIVTLENHGRTAHGDAPVHVRRSSHARLGEGVLAPVGRDRLW